MKYHLIAGALALVANIPGVATASDWKGYAGAFCHGSDTRDVRRSSTGIANWESSPSFVYCPIVRDVAAGGPDALKQVAISLFNNHASQGGYCTLISRPLSGGGVVDSHQVSWPAGCAARTIRLGPVDANNWGNYLVYCRLPGTDGARKSVIYNVRADEK